MTWIYKLNIAIQKVFKSLNKNPGLQPQIINLLHHLESNEKDKIIAIHIGDKVKLISTQNILCIEGDGRYSTITTIHKEVLTTPKNLKDFEDLFNKNSSFIRISKSTIINTLFIKEYYKGDPFIIVLNNDFTFEVARRKKTEILEKLNIKRWNKIAVILIKILAQIRWFNQSCIHQIIRRR